MHRYRYRLYHKHFQTQIEILFVIMIPFNSLSYVSTRFFIIFFSLSLSSLTVFFTSFLQFSKLYSPFLALFTLCPVHHVQYIPRNMHTVFALLCFVVVIHWLIFPYPSGLLHWHCGNLTIASVPAKQPWWIWINTSCEFIMNDCITTTKQSTTKPCAYFLGYTVYMNPVVMNNRVT